MSSQSIEKFKQYLENQKDDFLQDGRRVEGIIRDIFPEDKSLIFLLTSAWKAGIVSDLRQTANLEVTVAQFGDRLCQEYRLRESSALSAVRVWAYALGVTDDVPNISVSRTPSMGRQPSITAETKKCPFCAEEVKKDARKCKHCHSDISEDVIIKGVQDDELIRQKEALDREKQKLERERQEIEKMMALDVERQKLEAERSKLAEEKNLLATRQGPTTSATGGTGRDGRFIANDNGTVLDTKSGLIWAACDNGANINWDGANKYCKNYRCDGHTDWRLPSFDELKGLYDRGKSYKPTLYSYDVDLTGLIQLSTGFLWISEERGSDAAHFTFTDGTRRWNRKSKGYDTRVLPVRSGSWSHQSPANSTKVLPVRGKPAPNMAPRASQQQTVGVRHSKSPSLVKMLKDLFLGKY